MLKIIRIALFPITDTEKCQQRINQFKKNLKSKTIWAILCFIFYIVWLLYRLSCYGTSDESIVIHGAPKDNCIVPLIVNGTINLLKKNSRTKYSVYTSGCKMRYMDPFSPEVIAIYKPREYENCANDTDLITVHFDVKSRKYKLQLNPNAAEIITNETMKYYRHIDCCYKQVKRGATENLCRILPCKSIYHNYVVPVSVDAMLVYCKSKQTDKLIQMDAFQFIQSRPTKKSKMKKIIEQATSRKLSVLMIGIDSLSRMNFRRTMPFTYKYFKEKQWFTLDGYSKVSGSTFPNLVTLLTGRSLWNIEKYCNPYTYDGLYRCYYLWTYYKKQGYYTAYMEDWSHGTFNFNKKGFFRRPTDHYMRPMALAMEKNLPLKLKDKIPFCVGRRNYAEYVYNSALQFVNFYQNQSFFGLFWSNSFSHNDYQLPSSMDGKILDYLQTFERSGVMNKAVVVFLSDHGMRFGPLRQLSDGFLEELSPMFYMSLPQWFQEQHPDIVRTLKVNKKRLISPYDIYLTMRHILQLGINPMSTTLKVKAIGCEKCQSIFYEIPEDRTCKDAGIRPDSCSCNQQYTPVDRRLALIVQIVVRTVDEINSYLTSMNLSALCKEVKVKSIRSAWKQLGRDKLVAFRVEFTTEPNDALFEIYAYYEVKNRRMSVDLNRLSRINAYGQQSWCVNDVNALKTCSCIEEYVAPNTCSTTTTKSTTTSSSITNESSID